MSSRTTRSTETVLRNLGTTARRSAGLASCPGRDQRELTGLPAAHNSVDQSVILLDDTLQERPQLQEDSIVLGDTDTEEEEDTSEPQDSIVLGDTDTEEEGGTSDPWDSIHVGDTDTEEEEDTSESSR